MYIQCYGINHKTANVEIREKFTFQPDIIKTTLAQFGCGNNSLNGNADELVILSTCNRIEFYSVGSQPHIDHIQNHLSEIKDIPTSEFQFLAYSHAGRRAIDHLYRVATGLDSQVIGEHQIQNQVKEAFELSRGHNTAGPLLSRLFQSALLTGKRARSETTIGKYSFSISSLAIQRAEKSLSNLKNGEVVILGAGEMAELAVKSLIKKGVSKISVVNRTLKSAELLAKRWGGEAYPFERMLEPLLNADILITSTGAPHTLIHPEMLKPIMESRQSKKLVIIDIAVPRDVDLHVGDLPGVVLINIDQLKISLDKNKESRDKQIPLVESIINEEVRSFMRYLQTLDLVPVVSELKTKGEEIRISEFKKTMNNFSNLTQNEKEKLEKMTKAIVKKILHDPITCLREQVPNSDSIEYAEITRDLFKLDRKKEH